MDKIYSGKAKDIFKSKNANEVIVHFKDSATAGNGLKKSEIKKKGILNNEITEIIFQFLETQNIPTHFIKKIDERKQLCKRVDIIPLEIIVRNISAGSFSKRYGVKEGLTFSTPIFELSYKNDELGDPLMNDDHAIALEIVNLQELEYIKSQSLKINKLLKQLFIAAEIVLVDFKLEFGKLPNGKIILADEFSPDNSRLWDKDTGQKLDKDNFREDLGSLTNAYEIVLERLKHGK